MRRGETFKSLIALSKVQVATRRGETARDTDGNSTNHFNRTPFSRHLKIFPENSVLHSGETQSPRTDPTDYCRAMTFGSRLTTSHLFRLDKTKMRQGK